VRGGGLSLLDPLRQLLLFQPFDQRKVAAAFALKKNCAAIFDGGPMNAAIGDTNPSEGHARIPAVGEGGSTSLLQSGRGRETRAQRDE
jgi:hypothetical protein